MTEINRRELFKGGAAGILLGFLFRGRLGKLIEEPETIEQLPSAITITCTPQRTFRPERLVILGTVIGTRTVPETVFESCKVCEDRWATYCDACDDMGGRSVETGRMVERNVTVVPWLIEDISIGDVSQIAQGPIPGDIFGVDTVDSHVTMDATAGGKSIRFVVRYTGNKPGGEEFRGTLIGTMVDANGVVSRGVLPIHSGRMIAA